MLVAGDLFQTRNPNADAEQAVDEFFKAANEAKLPVAVIAGNHDSPRRLEALAGFMRNHNIHIIGRPGAADAGGVVTIDARGARKVVASSRL